MRRRLALPLFGRCGDNGPWLARRSEGGREGGREGRNVN